MKMAKFLNGNSSRYLVLNPHLESLFTLKSALPSIAPVLRSQNIVSTVHTFLHN